MSAVGPDLLRQTGYSEEAANCHDGMCRSDPEDAVYHDATTTQPLIRPEYATRRVQDHIGRFTMMTRNMTERKHQSLQDQKPKDSRKRACHSSSRLANF